MEKNLIVGIRKVNFEDKKTGNKINGFSIYSTKSVPEDSNLEGLMTGKDFVSNDVYDDMCNALGELTLVGKEVVFTYNRYGKVCGILV